MGIYATLMLYGITVIIVLIGKMSFFQTKEMRPVYQFLEVIFVAVCVGGLVYTLSTIEHPWYFILSTVPMFLIVLFDVIKKRRVARD